MYVNSGIWFAGQRDIIAANFLFVAAAIFSYAVRKQRLWLLFIAGAIAGYATLIRPTYLTDLSILVAILFLVPWIGKTPTKHTFKDCWYSTVWLLSGASFTVIVALLWGLTSGNLRDWYDQAVLFNLYLSFQGRSISYIQAVSRFSEYLFSWHWYLAFAALGLISWIRRNGLSVELLASIGITVTGIIPAIVQKAGFGYHWGAVFPLLALLTASWLGTVLNYFLKRPTHYVAIISLLFFWGVALLGLAKKTAAFLPEVDALISHGNDKDRILKTTDESGIVPYDISESAKFIESNTKPNDFVLVWGRHTHILYLAQRRSTTHFSYM